MEKFSVFVPKLLKEKENFVSARRSCKGCGKALGVRIAAKAVNEVNLPLKSETDDLKRIVSSGFNWNETSFSSIADFLIKPVEGKETSKRQKPVIAIDFSVFKKNLVSFQSILEKGKNILVLIYDNEGYMDDIIEKYCPLPFGINYHHDSPGKKEITFTLEAKNLFHIADNLGLSYAASASSAYPFDLVEKVKKGLLTKGTSLIHLHSPCPTGWMFSASDTVKAGILAVESGFHLLWEYTNKNFICNDLKINKESVSEYIGFQKRYRYAPDNFTDILSECLTKEAEVLKEFCKK